MRLLKLRTVICIIAALVLASSKSESPGVPALIAENVPTNIETSGLPNDTPEETPDGPTIALSESTQIQYFNSGNNGEEILNRFDYNRDELFAGVTLNGSEIVSELCHLDSSEDEFNVQVNSIIN